MDTVNLAWVTPDAEKLLVEMARVSNPDSARRGGNESRLINYMIRNKHWSPFEMVSMCVEIDTTRDIGRQILRHRSFSFQEFSQRYAEVEDDSKEIGTYREARVPHPTNRQKSLPSEDPELGYDFKRAQGRIYRVAMSEYKDMLARGVAKECARALLPEGLTSTRMYMAGNLRSWLHYCDLRCAEGTQEEHRRIALQCQSIIRQNFPLTAEAMFDANANAE